MIVTDEDALVCDFAETYGIFNFRSLSLSTAATLAQGLGQNSRIMRKLSNTEYSMETVLLAGVSDRLTHLIWMLSDDGRKGIHYPPMLSDTLLHKQERKENASFSSVEEFNAMWKQMVKEV